MARVKSVPRLGGALPPGPGIGHTAGTVPGDAPASSVAAQLRALLDSRDISVMALSRTLAGNGGKPESHRRYLMKLLRGDVPRPSRSTLDSIEDALGVERWTLRAPARASVPPRADLEEVRARLEEVERMLAALQADRLELGGELLDRISVLERENRARKPEPGQNRS